MCVFVCLCVYWHPSRSDAEEKGSNFQFLRANKRNAGTLAGLQKLWKVLAPRNRLHTAFARDNISVGSAEMYCHMHVCKGACFCWCVCMYAWIWRSRECCNILQHTQHTATHATHSNTQQHAFSSLLHAHRRNTATECNRLQQTATCCNMLQHTAAHLQWSSSWTSQEYGNIVQPIATHCNTLHHTAPHCTTPAL